MKTLPFHQPVSRRGCLRALAGGAAALALGAPAQAATPGRRPNVVVLLTDDQGSVDLNCYGATDLVTPRMDGLAADGVRFTDFYVTAPLCTASRISLLTGRHFQRAYLAGRGIHESETTIAELFRQAGYRTGLFGKWHAGGPPWDPPGQGFDEFLGHRVGAIDNYSHFSYWSGVKEPSLFRGSERYREDGTYLPDIVTRESIDFARRHREEPFFLFVSYNQPHYPLQPETRFQAMYDHLPEPRRTYAAAITSLDERIGRLLDALDELGLRQETIVLLLSDNGHSDEEGGRGGSAGPYRGGKKTFFEGGIRMPCILSWPGHVPAGAVRRQMTSSMDWLPTLAGFAGIDTGDLALDGRDLAAVVARDAPSPHERLHWMLGSYWAVREGDWKYIVTGDTHFLADLREDPGEATNIVLQHPDVAARMRAHHEAWLATGIEPIYTVEAQ